MARIIVAFPDPEVNRKIASVLERAGYEVFRTCSTGNEVMRAFTFCQDGVLICGAWFPDRTADTLAWDLGDRAVILVIGRPEQVAYCEHPKIFRRTTPINRAELLSSVELLLQEHDQRMPHREGASREIVNRAKEKLMGEYGLTEPEAHHALQRYAMTHGLKMADCARKLLEGKVSAAV